MNVVAGDRVVLVGPNVAERWKVWNVAFVGVSTLSVYDDDGRGMLVGRYDVAPARLELNGKGRP